MKVDMNKVKGLSVGFMYVALVGLGVTVIGFLLYRMLWVTNVERHEFGFSYDRMTGSIEANTNCGWWVRTPVRYAVHTIDHRPYQVSLSANKRILNAKLVRFDPKGLETFIAWHGRDAADNVEDMLEILKCYAFDRTEGKDCPFLEVLGEISLPQTSETNQQGAK